MNLKMAYNGLQIKLVNDMKTQINDLLLKMQTGENCIGETANHLLNLFGVSSTEGKLPRWTDNDVDASYLMGCMNVGGIDAISKELKRLEELGLKPHEAVGKVRGKW